MDFLTLLQVSDSTVRLATPLLLACLAGLFSERAGIFDIGLEGKMLAAAFAAGAAAAVAGTSSSPALASNAAWIGLLAAILTSVAFALLHGFASITQRGNQIVSGVAINFLAAGLTVLIAQNWFEQGGRTPALEGAERFQNITLPFAETLAPVPVIGPFYNQVISGHSALVYVALLAVPLSYIAPRQGRYGKLGPALLVFIVYLNLLAFTRSQIEDNVIPVAINFWWVHLLFLVLTVVFIYRRNHGVLLRRGSA